MQLKISSSPIPYPESLAWMESHVNHIIAGDGDECLWFLEHPPLYTAGTSAKTTDLLSDEFPVYETGRGGEYTYHGPGQQVVYAMLDLKKRHHGTPDLRRYVWQLEEWIIRILAEIGITGERRDGRVGIWVVNSSGAENKIAAIGIRIRKWVAYHGIAINLNPDLNHFKGIVPCGIKNHGVTSIEKEGKSITAKEIQTIALDVFDDIFLGK